jgi:hypothetical protein
MTKAVVILLPLVLAACGGGGGGDGTEVAERELGRYEQCAVRLDNNKCPVDEIVRVPPTPEV